MERSSLIATFFGPLDRSACSYFLLITVLFFISFVFIMVSEFLVIIQMAREGKFRIRVGLYGFMVIFNIFIAYFVNRLLYTMCSRAL